MSQSDLILSALLRGERLTKLDALKLGAGLSLNSRVADLRKLGYVIDCACATRDGRKVWEYHLVGPVQHSLFADALEARV